MKGIATCFVFVIVLWAIMAWFVEPEAAITGMAVEPAEAEFLYKLYFCPRDDCYTAMATLVNSSEQFIHCGLFDLRLKGLIDLLDAKSREVDVKVMVDDTNHKYVEKRSWAKKDTSDQLSHNKFCVIDGKMVSTGSMNPTENDAVRNNNNLIVIQSAFLAENYEDEFQELWSGEFGSGRRVKNPVVFLGGTRVENYFCPEDSCAKRVEEVISRSNESVLFMAFSFTKESIADTLLFSNASIKGVVEKRGSGSEYSQFNRLKEFGVDVVTDTNPYTMHHKVFIIDEKIVVTGSFNPTGSGDYRNDENILIIHNEEIAKRFVEEFGYVRPESPAKA